MIRALTAPVRRFFNHRVDVLRSDHRDLLESQEALRTALVEATAQIAALHVRLDALEARSSTENAHVVDAIAVLVRALDRGPSDGVAPGPTSP